MIWQDRFIERTYEKAGYLTKLYNRKNYRGHPALQRNITQSSLDRLGYVDEIRCGSGDWGKKMFDGHLRVEIALLRGGPEALVPVNWYALSEAETDQALLLHDTTTAMADIDFVMLDELWKETPALEIPEFDQWLGELFKENGLPGGNGVEPPEPQIDKAKELQEKWGTKVGQVWQLGEHRLAVGDCTDKATVEAVMRGERLNLVLTDPPYNVGINYGEAIDDNKIQADYEKFSTAWFGLWQLASDRQVITPGYYNLACWARLFEKPCHIGIWTKTNSMTRGRVSRFACYEPVLFYGRDWKRERPNDIFDYPISEQAGVGNHPCPKPLKMWLDLIENYSDAGDLIGDPFVGSGTTIIAGEQLGRRVRACEIDEGYAAVSIQRFVDLGTGHTPHLVGG